MSARHLAKNAIWSLLNQIFSRGSLMLSAIILARSLDVSEYAAYSYFQLTVSMISTYAAMGIGVAATKLFSEEQRNDSLVQNRTLAAMIFLSFVFSVLAFLLVALFFSALIGGTISMPRWLFATGVLVLALNAMPSGAIIGLEKQRQMAIVSFVVGLILLAGALWSAHIQNAVFSMWIFVLVALIQALTGAVIIGKRLGWRYINAGFPFGLADIFRVLSFSGPMFLASLLASSGSWLVGRIIMQGKNGEYDFALYSIGLQWFALGMLLPAQVSVVLVPRLVRCQPAELNSKSSRQQIARIGFVAAAGSATFMLVIGLLFGDKLLALYGDNYLLNRWFVGAYLLAAVFGSVTAIFCNILLASGRPLQWFVLTCVWFFALLLISHLFKALGGWAGAIAYIGAYFMLMFVSWIYAYKSHLI